MTSASIMTSECSDSAVSFKNTSVESTYHSARAAHFARVDRVFVGLLIFQYLAGILTACLISPLAWSGTHQSVHLHVWAALILGAIITIPPVMMAVLRPGMTMTRYTVAAAQMLYGVLLIHLTGGRIEAHFHIFGSLAFLTLYRDWRVLVAATLIAVADHVLRGMFFPFSIYGTTVASNWRWLEHSGWVVFEDIVLVMSCLHSEREMRQIATHAVRARESEERVRAVLDNALDAVITMDARGTITGWNPQAETMFGWPCGDAIGRSLAETIIPPALRSVHGAGMERYLKTGVGPVLNKRIEVSAIRQSGEEFPVELAISPLKSSSGGDTFSAFIRDISDRRKHETEMRTAREAAEAASLSKTAFLANMSHEIRTPMTAILGYSDLLLEPNSTQSDRIDSLQVIRRNSRHLLQLINDILDISKIEAGKMTAERLPCELPQLVAEVMSMSRPRAVEKELLFRVVFEGLVPRTISTDALRVKQILTNVIGNAVKFTAKGLITMRVSYVAADDLLAFDVADTGVGMTPEQMAKLFQPFAQADESTTRRFGGTGLGLAISKRLTEMLGGTLTVTSQFMIGSTFRATIKAGAPAGVEMLSGLTEASLFPQQPESESGSMVRLNANVLLAEDGPDNQVLISMYLKQAGARVTVADNGRVAVNLARTQPFDVILMDMQMPELDGYGATSELRRRGLKMPIIALTAHAMTGDRDKCLGAGCTDYLTKPVDRGELIRLVKKYEPSEPVETKPPAAVRLAADPGAMTMEKAVAIFVSRLPERVGQINTLVASQNVSDLRRVAHQLKGAGGGFGFPKISEVAAAAERSVENLMKAVDAQADVSVEEIARAMSELVATLKGVDGYKEPLPIGASGVAESVAH